MKLDVNELFKGDICTVKNEYLAGSYYTQFVNRKCEFIKLTKGGLVEVQLCGPNIRNSFPRSLIHEYIEPDQVFKYYNAEYENEPEAVEFRTFETDLEDVAVEAAKLYAAEEPELCTTPIAIMLIDKDGVKSLFEVTVDITYDYYASLVDY